MRVPAPPANAACAAGFRFDPTAKVEGNIRRSSHGRDDVLGEAAGEGDREISGAGRDRPADGKGGPPSDHKIIPPADIEECHRPAHDKYDNGGDHDRKDEFCFAFHLSKPLH
jgi:hypothetical protein